MHDCLSFLTKHDYQAIALEQSKYFALNPSLRNKTDQNLAILLTQTFAKNNEPVEGFKIIRKFLESLKDHNKIWPLISILLNLDTSHSINRSAQVKFLKRLAIDSPYVSSLLAQMMNLNSV